MSEDTAAQARAVVESVYRAESRRVFATLIRLLGDFDLAEEALQDAFRTALEKWPTDGVPANPRAWLVSTGRFKAIDGLRRRARFVALPHDVAERLDDEPAGVDHDEHAFQSNDPALQAFDRRLRTEAHDSEAAEDPSVEDDRLRLMFTCCHPALAPDAQVALTLREVCGLTTEQIASAFLSAAPTLAQRIVRAKAKIREARIPYRVPDKAELPERLDAVLRVIYLVFNEGYSASSGSSLTRPDLSAEAIRLARLLVELLPEPEALGLLALLLLQESRRGARVSAEGELVLLDEQDRNLWNREQIREGVALAARSLGSGRAGGYALQAAIASVHAQAADPASTDWARIAACYDLLLALHPSPVVELNRAVAVAMRDGPAAGLALIETLLERGALDDYHLAHAARADLHRRLGQTEPARAAYRRALALVRQDAERRFLERRLAELPPAPSD